ncbi:unnamed protein product [Didymodactylos carnosus]|uniref:Proteinase inhibitor I42 chagasin domain-containing protein n=1 Tax=Didymodactylos carnosus TaxID=1234261 RepID=A0A815JVM0_9BILA|nr:unnamed protein product [Didymodactylos carnosus]CAF1384183.1 unnamed protein product [Didymodactylos carnosus]CAF4037604.1 unnamed protein product [Didymodactylos carnosus]CAF4279272.1 unnamed protein product [Didymodactylos carnosus]
MTMTDWLSSNPSTGFSWFIHPASTPSLLLPSSSATSFVACSYESNRHKPFVLGGGGNEIWEFLTGSVNNKITKIALQYQRPWLDYKDEPEGVWYVKVIAKAENHS